MKLSKTAMEALVAANEGCLVREKSPPYRYRIIVGSSDKKIRQDRVDPLWDARFVQIGSRTENHYELFIEITAAGRAFLLDGEGQT